MQIKTIGLKVGVLVIFGLGIALYIGLSFSRLLVPLFPIIVGLLVWFVTKTQRKLIKTATTPLYQITRGLVKVQGTVSASKTFITPHFKQECIAYNYREASISYDSEDNFERENSATVKEEFQDFYLNNETGKIKVILNRLNLAFLPAETDTKHSIKYAVDDIRYTERILKNGDVINVLGYASQNTNYQFEINEQGDQPLIISTPDFEAKSRKSFQVFKYLTPYFILMYVAVNYFLFFAPVEQHVEKSTAFVLFSFFGMPILGVVFGIIGNRFSGLTKDLLNSLGGICFSTSLLSFPLSCLLFMTNTNYYIIERVWLSVLLCSTLAFVVNFRKIETAFDKREF